MALSPEDQEYLEDVLQAVADAPPNQLSDWERGFMQDQQTRFDEWGEKMMLSPKQWKIINKVAEALDVAR